MVLCAPLLCWIGLYTVWGNQVNHPTGFSAFTTNHKIRWNQGILNALLPRRRGAGGSGRGPGVSPLRVRAHPARGSRGGAGIVRMQGTGDSGWAEGKAGGDMGSGRGEHPEGPGREQAVPRAALSVPLFVARRAVEDALAGPPCTRFRPTGSTRRPIATSTHGPVIRQILRHLQRGADPPPMAPARASQDPLAWASP